MPKLAKKNKKVTKVPLKSKQAKTKATKASASAKASAQEPVAPKPKPKPLTKELLEVRANLMGMLHDLRQGIKQEVEVAGRRDLAHITDSSDIASDAAEGDLAFRIAESEGVEAEEIQKAIDKIDSGTYGECEECGKTVGADRLRFLPFATHCIKCQSLAEIRRKDNEDELDDLAEGEARSEEE